MDPEKKSNGALVGLVIIIIILVAGGIYLWQTNTKATEKMKADQAQAEAALNQDSSALNSLEQEITTTDTDIGVDLNNVN